MQATIQYIRRELYPSRPEEEIRELIKLIFWALRGYSLTDFYLNQQEHLTPEERDQVVEMVSRLKKPEPVQYVIGQTEFFGMILRVNPHVLIPRPETEELVKWVITEQKYSPSSILDIGCGSGCMALALKKAFPAAGVRGCDISSDALLTARNNASFNRLEVGFFEADILNWPAYLHWGEAELIVSNPPYVTEKEKQFMNSNVLDYEPHLALFVPDKDPLLYYRHIAEFALRWLSGSGQLYFEVNEHYGSEVVNLLVHLGFTGVIIRKDFRGKERMVRALKNQT